MKKTFLTLPSETAFLTILENELQKAIKHRNELAHLVELQSRESWETFGGRVIRKDNLQGMGVQSHLRWVNTGDIGPLREYDVQQFKKIISHFNTLSVVVNDIYFDSILELDFNRLSKQDT